MSRKEIVESQNIGTAFGDTVDPYFEGPELAQARTSGVMVERVLFAVLQTELNKLTLTENVENLRRIFSHAFDPMAGTEERDDYVAHLQRRPPTVVLGYPRTTAQPPVVSIVLGEEEEDDESTALSDYLGESLPGEPGPYAEYIGNHFTQTHNIFIFSDHPVITAYLYHLVKLVIFSSKPFLIKAGIIEPRISGGELSPDEGYTPEDWFSRVVRLSCRSLTSVPVLRLDPSTYKLKGLFMDDLHVEGIQGGVHGYSPGDPEGA